MVVRSTMRRAGSTLGILGLDREADMKRALIAGTGLCVVVLGGFIALATLSTAGEPRTTVRALRGPTVLTHQWGHMHPPANNEDPVISAEEAEQIAAQEAMGKITSYTATLVSYSDADSPGLQLSPTPRLSWLIEFQGDCMMPNMRDAGCIDGAVFGVVVDATTGEVIVAGARST